jgi:heme/copper-type cytochrome/quinol oxidase subunit 3
MSTLKIKNTNLLKCEQHPFHIVSPSPWPFFLSVYLLFIIFAFVEYLQFEIVGEPTGGIINILSNAYFYDLIYKPALKFFLTYHMIIMFILCVISWLNDVIIEGTFEGQHTAQVQHGLRMGFGLFIVSEIMVFFSAFWAFFHSSLSPSIFIGNVWPPLGITPLQTWGIPFLNTLILLSSGVTVTYAHRALIASSVLNCSTELEGLIYFKFIESAITEYGLPDTGETILALVTSLDEGAVESKVVFSKFRTQYLYKTNWATYMPHVSVGLFITIFYGIVFSLFQRYEYIHAPFAMNDSIYGSTFYATTGLHGLHVLVGTIFLIVGLLRTINRHFTAEHHVGLEAAIWYWHFVDVVWLFLFVSVYWWSAY